MKKLFFLHLKFISNWVSYILSATQCKSIAEVHVGFDDRSSLVSPQ